MTQTANDPALDRKLTLTRVFNAPRELVYRAWTDPRQLAIWWGPTGFTNPVCELDLKPFGEFRIDMRGPDGTVYPNIGAFREIVEPERLIFTLSALNQSGQPLFENLNTVTFEAFEGSKTLVTVDICVLWETIEAAPMMAGMSMGWSLTLDRLSDFVSHTQSSRELVATHFFKAPRPLVYEMWTKPEHLIHWWGPRGFTTTIHEMDVRPGGVWRLTLHGPDGTDYPNHKEFEEVVPLETLVINNLKWPEHRMYIRFKDAEGGTAVDVLMLFESGEVCQKVIEEFGADKGLRENLEKLEEYLAAR